MKNGERGRERGEERRGGWIGIRTGTWVGRIRTRLIVVAVGVTKGKAKEDVGSGRLVVRWMWVGKERRVVGDLEVGSSIGIGILGGGVLGWIGGV